MTFRTSALPSHFPLAVGIILAPIAAASRLCLSRVVMMREAANTGTLTIPAETSIHVGMALPPVRSWTFPRARAANTGKDKKKDPVARKSTPGVTTVMGVELCG